MSRRKKGHVSESEWLRSHGFDGLYHPDLPDGCGCWNDDLRPCGEIATPCRGGREIAYGNGIYKPEPKA